LPNSKCKALPRFFLCIFSSLTCLNFCFQQVGSSAVEVPARLYWDLPTSGRYQENSALLRKRTWVQALLRFSTCSLGLRAFGTGPPIQKAIKTFWFHILNISKFD
jgi:hypothetical protein